MTIASKGSLGTSLNTGNNQSSTTHTTAVTNVAVGDLAVIIMAVDNNATVNGDEGAVTSVTGGSNVWVKAGEFCNANAAAQAGATVSVWYTLATTQMNTGTVITFNFSNNASRDESCSTGWCFTRNGNTKIIETPQTQDSDAVDVGALDVTTPNEHRLRIRAIAEEANDGTQMTNTASWTLFTNERSAAVATAMCVRGEWIISTGTGSSSNPTLAVTSGDSASIYITFADPPWVGGWEAQGAQMPPTSIPRAVGGSPQ